MTRSIKSSLLIIIVIIGLLLISCREKSKDSSYASQRFVTEEELRALETQLMKEIEENRTKSCPRPVLRGIPVVANDMDDIVSAMQGDYESNACVMLLKEKSDSISNALFVMDDDYYGLA